MLKKQVRLYKETLSVSTVIKEFFLSSTPGESTRLLIENETGSSPVGGANSDSLATIF